MCRYICTCTCFMFCLTAPQSRLDMYHSIISDRNHVSTIQTMDPYHGLLIQNRCTMQTQGPTRTGPLPVSEIRQHEQSQGMLMEDRFVLPTGPEMLMNIEHLRLGIVGRTNHKYDTGCLYRCRGCALLTGLLRRSPPWFIPGLRTMARTGALSHLRFGPP